MLGTGDSTFDNACAAVVPRAVTKVSASSVAFHTSSKRESAQAS
jgi:hypothetical protein